MSEASTPTILAVGAHPDDIEFGCGAILLKESAAGSCIHLLVCSKGESGSNGSPEEREKECKSAADAIGASLEFIECGGDGKIEGTRLDAMGIARIIRTVRPSIILAPSLVKNQHPDHCAVGGAVRDAARLARYAGLEDLKGIDSHAIDSLFYYSITPGSEPSGKTPFLFDVSDQLAAWQDLMACHKTQMKTRRYLDLQVSRARTLGLQIGCEFAQALWPNDAVVLNGLNSAPRGMRLF